MKNTLEIIGIPTSAGATGLGQEQAPAALRAAGLVEAIRAMGHDVIDRHDDPPVWHWRPDPANIRAQNLGPTVKYASYTRKRVAQALAARHLSLVLGGDCTIELGTIAAHLDAGHRVGLVYLDLHADMNIPDAIPDGPLVGGLDWMGVAHMLGLEGGRSELIDIGPYSPLLQPNELALVGFEPKQASEFEQQQIKALGIQVIGWEAIARDPEGEIANLLGSWGPNCDSLLVHYDVDVLDFLQMPIADSTMSQNVGLTLDQATRAIAALTADPRFSALTVTEVNPSRGAEDGSTIHAFVQALAKALSQIAKP